MGLGIEHRLLCTVVCLFCTVLAYAQDRSDTLCTDNIQTTMEGQLGEIVVTGTGTQHYSAIAPIRTEVISQRDLVSLSGSSLSDILTALSPSFDTTHSGMGSGLTLGGLSNSYILVLINGRRMHGDTGGQNDLSKIDPSQIEKIEIVKGAASTLYGSDAIAGVINVITKDYLKRPIYLDNNTRIGSYGGIQQSNTLAIGHKGFSSVTQYSGQRSDGWQNSTQEIYRDKLYENSTTQTVSAYYNHQLQQEFTWQLSRQWELHASGMLYKKRIFHEPGEPRLRQYHLRYNDQAARVGAIYKPSAYQTYTLEGSFDRHAYFYDYHIRYMDERLREEILDDGRAHYVPEYFFYQPGESSLESDQRQYILHGKGVIDLNPAHRLSVGLEGIVDHLIAENRMATPSASAYTIALYAQDEWDLSESWNVTAGLRAIYHQAFGAEVTPKLSFHYHNGNKLHVRGSYARGFKTPTIKELYYEYERTMMGKLRMYLGNPDLKPQTSDFFSLGATYSPDRKWTFNLYGSYNMLGDMIALIPTEMPAKYKSDEGEEFDAVMQYVNGEKARVTELEASMNWRPSSHWKFTLAYTYTDAWADIYEEKMSKKAGEVIIVRREIDGTSNHKGTVGATYMYQRDNYDLTVGLHGRMQSDRHYFYYGDAPGYMLWNLSSTHKLTINPKWQATLSVGVDNLLDYNETHPYGLNYGTKTPGRTFYATLRVAFGKKNKANY